MKAQVRDEEEKYRLEHEILDQFHLEIVALESEKFDVLY
jgi:hypothetical protein